MHQPGTMIEAKEQELGFMPLTSMQCFYGEPICGPIQAGSPKYQRRVRL